MISYLLLFLCAATASVESWGQKNFFLTKSRVFIDNGNHRKINSGRPSVINSQNPTRLYSGDDCSLTFSSQFDRTSDKLPTTSLSDAQSFCRSRNCRNHFLSAGGKSKIEDLEWTENLNRLWIEASEKWYGVDSMPQAQEGDSILKSETYIQFPGLKLLNEVYLGVKLVEDSKKNLYYLVLGIAEKKTPIGSPPLVWMYRKLTGEEQTTEYSPPKAYARSTISLAETDDGGYALRFQCNVKVFVKFPKLLMKLLPTSIEKMEEQGSASVAKAVGRDIDSSLESTVEAFKSWKADTAVLQE